MSFKHVLVSLALFLSACVSQAQIIGGGSTVGNFLANDGSATNPSYSFVSEQNTGFYRGQLNAIDVGVAGNPTHRLQSNGFWMKNATPSLFFGSGPDVSIKRTQTNTVGVNADGSTFTTFANIGGTLYLDASTITQSSASQTLKSYTLPASVMTVNGKTLRATALIKTTNNANAKAVGIQFCGSSSLVNVTASVNGLVRVTGYATRTGANTWIISLITEEGLQTGTLTQAKMNGLVSFNPGTCFDGNTNTIAMVVNTAGSIDTSGELFMVELLN